MPSATELKFDATINPTITLASLAHSAVLAGRQSAFIQNSDNRPGALVYVKLTSGAVAPTASAQYHVYLLRRDAHASSTVTTDNAGDSDADITIENAPRLGSITVTATTSKAFTRIFDTAEIGPLGPSYAIAIVNASGQALHATAANHVIAILPYYLEAQ